MLFGLVICLHRISVCARLDKTYIRKAAMADKILIVDDDVETLRLVGLMLQRQGYQIITASNGSQAITLTYAEKPDLIVLDIMMPDLDGYQVTREVRSNPKTAHIPILMFTAKSQVDDKVVGYEVGADDYLTKPIHPMELVAHVRSLLGRGKARATGPIQRGYTIGVVSPKGGLGASSLTLNLGISFYLETRKDAISAELRPGQGTWASELGLRGANGLSQILRMDASDIVPSTVEKALTRTTYGIRLLIASNRMEDASLSCCSAQFQAIIEQLPFLTQLVLLDFGSCILPDSTNLISQCDEAILVTEPYPGTVAATKQRLEELQGMGFGHSKLLNVVMINRIRGDMQLSASQLNDMIGTEITIGIPPAPEIAYQAGLRSAPLVLVQPDGMMAKQYERLARLIAEHMRK
jgi:CheY-like chemotaxis protein/MinD-like ATPase involved in chromosome partitioning or flagellar assembly